MSGESHEAFPSPQSFLVVCRDVFLVGLADKALRSQILRLCSVILLSGERWREKTARRQIPELSGICLYPPAEAGYLCIPPALQLLKELVSSYTPEEENQHQENQEDPTAVVLGVVANLFQKVIELLARRLRKQPEEGKQVFNVYLLAVHWSQTFMISLLNFSISFTSLQLCHSAVPGLTDFLQAVLICDSAPIIGVFSTLFAAILVEGRHLLQKVGMSSTCLNQMNFQH